MQRTYRYGDFIHFGRVLTIRNSEMIGGQMHHQIYGTSVWIPESSFL
jgi:hypothetical protein